jgi:hypothetical protein
LSIALQVVLVVIDPLIVLLVPTGVGSSVVVVLSQLVIVKPSESVSSTINLKGVFIKFKFK